MDLIFNILQVNKMSIDKKVSVKLLDSTHQHAGTDYTKGDVITLRESQAKKLIDLNKAELSKGETSDKSTN